jgi:hypothetical protein
LGNVIRLVSKRVTQTFHAPMMTRYTKTII